MARRQPKTYTAEEIRVIEVRLEKHGEILAVQISKALSAFRNDSTFDNAVLIRGPSQFLCSTFLCLSHFDMILELAKHEPQTIPGLEECGLDTEEQANG